MQRFEISVGEPWDFEGPDGPNRIVVDFAGIVNGPSLPNWQTRYLLLKVVVPFTHADELVSFLVAAPRYDGDTLESIIAKGGTVGVSRVRPTVQLSPDAKLSPAEVEYIIIGGLSRVP